MTLPRGGFFVRIDRNARNNQHSVAGTVLGGIGELGPNRTLDNLGSPEQVHGPPWRCLEERLLSERGQHGATHVCRTL